MTPVEPSGNTYARLFLAMPVPPTLLPSITPALQHYANYTDTIIATDKWHITLFFLGDEVLNHTQYLSRLLQVLPQTFVPTVTLTHVGRGINRAQLWAYVHPTPLLLQLRQTLKTRLKSMRFPLPEDDHEYIPHITLGSLFNMSRGFGLADYALPATFTVPEIYLYRTTTTPSGHQYSIEGRIPLAAKAHA